MPSKGVNVTVTKSQETQSTRPVTTTETITGTGLKRAVFDSIIATDQWAPPAFPILGGSKAQGSSFTNVTKLLVDQEQTYGQDDLDRLIPIVADQRLLSLQVAADLANSIVDKAFEPGFTLVTGVAYTVQPLDDLIALDGASAGADVAVTLPLAADTRGRIVYVKSDAMGGFSSHITPAGSDTINRVAGVLVVAGDDRSRCLMSDGVSDWKVVGAV